MNTYYCKCLATASLLLWLIALSPVFGEVPCNPLRGINFSGRVTTSSGDPVTDGVYSFEVCFYQSSSGSLPVYCCSSSVQTENGLYQTTIGYPEGDTSSSDAQLMPRNPWEFYEITFNGELTGPRQQLTAVPRTFEAVSVRGDIQTSPGHMIVRDGTLTNPAQISFRATQDSGLVSLQRWNGFAFDTAAALAPGRLGFRQGNAGADFGIGQLSMRSAANDTFMNISISDAVVKIGFGSAILADSVTVLGGHQNTASAIYSTAVGGRNLTASGIQSTVLGGWDNQAAQDGATVVGGEGNRAMAVRSTVAGGYGNFATGLYSVVTGGTANTASGNYSFAAGRRAKSLHTGSFVFADSQNTDFSSSGPNQFMIRAKGGVGLNQAPVAPHILSVNGSIRTSYLEFSGDGSTMTSAPLESRASQGSFSSPVILSSTSGQDLKSDSMSSGSGYVLALVSAEASVSHTNGTASQMAFGVSNTSLFLDADQLKNWTIPASAPTGTYSVIMSAQKVFGVSAGISFFHAVGYKGFSSPNFSIDDLTLSLVYVPRAGGIVSSASTFSFETPLESSASSTPSLESKLIRLERRLAQMELALDSARTAGSTEDQ